jgi:hypothetical protein
MLCKYEAIKKKKSTSHKVVTRLSIVPMIRPMEWQGLLIPILPTAMRETLNAPVPYVCGVISLTQTEITQLLKNQAMVVLLDEDDVLLPDNFSLFPEERKL